MQAASAGSSAFAPLTAAAILDAKLDQLQSRLAHLWAAAHSPLALQQPIVASLYMRQLRLLAFHGDIHFSTAHTQLNFCSRCCQVHIPAVNVDVQIAPSRERKRRDKRRSQRRQWALKQSQAAAADATMDEAPSATDSDAAAMPRKRKRSASPATPARPLASSGVDSTRSHTAHEIVYRCHTCGQVDRASGISHRQRQLVRESNTDLTALVANAAERDAQPAIEEAKQAAAKKQRLLQSLQTQTAVSAPVAPKPNLASLHMLSQAQQKFEQAKATLQHQSRNNQLAGASTAAAAMSMQPPPTTIPSSNSFFAEQFKNAAGIASIPSPSPPPHTPSKPFSFTASGAKAAAATSSSLIQPPPAAAAAAPFSFSRSGTASAAPKIGGGSLYSLLQSATAPPAAPLHVPITSTPSAPFSFSAPPKTPQQPKSKAQTPKTPGNTPAPSTSIMQGIAIIGGIGSSSTPSKTYTVMTKGGGKNNAAKKKY